MLSLPAWGAWIEIEYAYQIGEALASLPAWGAWIEIIFCQQLFFVTPVAPRMGSVD